MALLLALLGPPCRFTRMCVTIAHAALDRLYGGCDLLRASDLSALHGELARVRCPHVLLHADAPDEGLVEALRRSDASNVIVTTDPASFVRDLMAEHALDPVAAVRSASRYFSTLHDVALAPGAIVIHRMGYEYNVEAIVREIMRAVGKTPDAFQVDELLSAVFPDGRIDGVWCVSKILDIYFSIMHSNEMRGLLGLDSIRLVDSVLGEFAQIGTTRFNSAHWPAGVFLSGNRIGHSVDGPIEMTGSARILVYGPYIHLPPGQWVGSVKFRVGNNRGGVSFLLDVYSVELLYAQEIALPQAAQIECNFVFSTHRAAAPVEIRLTQNRGAIEGELAFLGVSIERLEN